MIGTHVSHYHVVSELGKGGMGVVYQAEDAKLNRPVALKLLAPHLLASESDRGRFFREARAAAALQHPNIATVFEIDETNDGQPFIVMEFIEGQSLEQMIANGPLPIDNAVKISIQIAEALKAAHAKEIIHRDVKSANVMLGRDDRAKVLDFGLAKTIASTKLTQLDSTLGTAAYMSPEQASGEEVDHRTDLWSLGVVLYEMIAGKLPFAGDYEQAVVYKILNETPRPLTAIRTGVPMELEHVVNKALAKDIELRYQTASDFIADLKAISVSAGRGNRHHAVPISAEQPSAPTTPTHRPGMPPWGWVAVLSALILGIAGTWFGLGSASHTEKRVVRLGLNPLDADVPPRALAVSPSGSYLAYSDGEQVFIRNMETAETWAIPSSSEVDRMVFTPDENWLLLERPGLILRTRIRDGTPYEVTTVAAAFATVNVAPDNAIIYEGGGRIWRLDAAGNVPEFAIEMDELIFYNEPRLMNDGRSLVVEQIMATDSRNVGVFDYPSGRLRGVLPIDASYFGALESHLVFLREGELNAVAIDLDEPKLLGPVVPLGILTDRAAWWVSNDGHLFYAPVNVEGGTAGFSSRFLQSVRWDGTVSDLPPPRAFYEHVRLDPSARRAAVVITDGPRDIWVVDLFTGIRKPVTTGSSGTDPSWHPAADSILYVVSDQSGVGKLAVRAADGSGDSRTLYRLQGADLTNPQWSPDGQFVLFNVVSSNSAGQDIWQLDLASGVADPVIGGEGDQMNGTYSPDGRLVAFQGPDARGNTVVWVQTAAFTDLPQVISGGTGSDPRWGPDGDFLYFMDGNEIRRVAVDASESTPRVSDIEMMQSITGLNPMWDITPDESGIIRVTDVRVSERQATWADSSRTQVHVILNWVEELAGLVPRSR